MSVLLVGAGGHAKAIAEGLASDGIAINAYVDPSPAPWLDARQITTDDAAQPSDGDVMMGLGGVRCDQLVRRLALLDAYLARGFTARAFVHATATVSASATIEPGAIVLAGAVVQPGAILSRGAIVNTGAIIEHDAMVDAGCHVAPGAIVLGGARLGPCCMIGAGAVVLPFAEMPARTLVPALSRFPEAE